MKLECEQGVNGALFFFSLIDFPILKMYNVIQTEHKALVGNLTREGGETMALEAVKLVAQAEQQSKDRKAEAALEAKKRLADAEKAGMDALATTKKQADAKVKELLAQADKDAAEDATKIKQQADADCAALRTNAKKRLEEAASLIVRKVVDA